MYALLGMEKVNLPCPAPHLKKVAFHITCKRTTAHNGEASAPEGPNRQAYCRRRSSIALTASRARAGQQRCQEHGFLQSSYCLCSPTTPQLVKGLANVATALA